VSELFHGFAGVLNMEKWDVEAKNQGEQGGLINRAPTPDKALLFWLV
jgi:hypothetical protein